MDKKLVSRFTNNKCAQYIYIYCGGCLELEFIQLCQEFSEVPAMMKISCLRIPSAMYQLIYLFNITHASILKVIKNRKNAATKFFF